VAEGLVKSGLQSKSFNVENYHSGPYKAFPAPRDRLMDYLLMRKYEATTRRVLVLLRNLVLRKLGHYSHPDPRIEEAVGGLMSRIRGGVPTVVAQLCSAMWAGFAVVELEWKRDPTIWSVERTNLLHPLTFFSPQNDDIGIRLDEREKRVKEFIQYPEEIGAEGVTLSEQQVIYWPLFQELREEVLGNSLLASARRAWYAKTMNENFWNTFSEKLAMPTPVIRCGHEMVEDPKNPGQEISLVQFIADFYEQLSPGQALVFASDVESPSDIDALTMQGDGKPFLAILDYWREELFASLLTPRMILEEPEHGSRAQAGSMLELFFMLVDGMRREIGGVLVDQLSRPLIIANVGPMASYGEWSWDELSQKDLQLLAQVFESVERGKSSAAMSGNPITEKDDRKLRETFEAIYPPAESNEVLPVG